MRASSPQNEVAIAAIGCVASLACSGAPAIGGATDAPPTFSVSGSATFTLVESQLEHGYTLPSFVSDDGGVFVGLSGEEPLNGLQAFRWTRDGGARAIEPPGVVRAPDALGLFGLGVNRDLTTLVGLVVSDHDGMLFRWSERDGIRQIVSTTGTAPLNTKVAFSADGSIVVGQSEGQAFRWTAAGGLETLGFLPGDTTSEAIAVSADGKVIIGQSSAAGAMHGRVFRWTADGGLVPLGVPAGLAACEFRGQISADGGVVFGTCSQADRSLYGAMFRWTEATGVEALPVPAPWPNARPLATSTDGSVMVGELQLGPPTVPGTQAAITTVFRWTEASGVVPLRAGELDHGSFLEDFAGEGAFVVGRAYLSGSSGERGVRWTADGQPTLLEPLAGFTRSAPSSVSADGRIAAGVSELPAPNGSTSDFGLNPIPVDDGAQRAATIWDAEGHPRVASDVLTSAGADLRGARLVSARVSRDGTTLIGGADDANGRKAAWIATLP